MSKERKKGVKLEERIASWLSRLGYEVITRDLVRGKVAKRPYEVDVHAFKKRFLRGRFDVWVECKDIKGNIKRTHITKLVESARDVREGGEEGISEWWPDILMIVATSGFDIDAIRLADKYGIYCVLAKKRGYEFMGKMTREDFENDRKSEYY